MINSLSPRSRRWLLASAAIVAMSLAALILVKRDHVHPQRTFTLYDIARRCGQSDRLTPRSRDWHRYDEKIAAFADVEDRERIFTAGYDDGFDQHPEEPIDGDELDYDTEYRRGRSDLFEGRASSAKSRGYRDGYEGGTHAFGRPY